MDTVQTRLQALGISLPEPAKPVANYVPFVQTNGLLFISGQISAGPDGLICGKLGAELDVKAGQNAARHCALHLMAQMQAALSDLTRVQKIVRLGGFVSATPEFTEIAPVINGASDLMVEVFGEAVGRHARAAVACPVLPLNVAVEIDAVVAY